MNMELGYKEKIIMHALYPKKQLSTRTNALKSLLFSACLFELAEKNIFCIENGKFWCQDTRTGTQVLDDTISLLVPLSGKNLLRLQLLSLQKSGRIYKEQIKTLSENHILVQEDISFISWKVGSKYRVRKYDMLKPGITKFERALVYGRKPDRETVVMTVLAGEGNLFGNIFSIREFRKKATERYMELLKSDYLRDDPTLYGLYKILRKTLTAQKVNTVYPVKIKPLHM